MENKPRDIAIFLALTSASAFIGSVVAKDKTKGAIVGGLAYVAAVVAYLNLNGKDKSPTKKNASNFVTCDDTIDERREEWDMIRSTILTSDRFGGVGEVFKITDDGEIGVGPVYDPSDISCVFKNQKIPFIQPRWQAEKKKYGEKEMGLRVQKQDGTFYKLYSNGDLQDDPTPPITEAEKRKYQERMEQQARALEARAKLIQENPCIDSKYKRDNPEECAGVINKVVIGKGGIRYE